MIPPDPEARLYRLLAEIVDDLEVPAGAAGAAIEMIRAGRPMHEAVEFCLDAIERRRLDAELLALATSEPRRRRARAVG